MFFFPKNRLVDHHVPDGFHQNVDPFWLPRYPTPRWFLTEKNGEISLWCDWNILEWWLARRIIPKWPNFSAPSFCRLQTAGVSALRVPCFSKGGGAKTSSGGPCFWSCGWWLQNTGISLAFHHQQRTFNHPKLTWKISKIIRKLSLDGKIRQKYPVRWVRCWLHHFYFMVIRGDSQQPVQPADSPRL